MGPGNRPLDLDWLEDFMALADSGNFSKAAQLRAIAQPAFSRHIRALEEWVGVDLFDRSAHPAVLTPAGQRFRPLLEDVLGSLEAARTKARAAHAPALAALRFAATHVLSLAFFPRWLAAQEAELGPRTVQMYSDNLRGCEDLMLQRSVQFLLCHAHAAVPGRLDEGGYPMQPVGHDVLMPVAAAEAGQPRHVLGGDGPAPVLAYHAASGLGRILQSQLPAVVQDESAYRTVFAAHHAAVLKTMALEGRGIAWLPRSIIDAELRAGLLAPAGDAGWSLPLEIRLYRQRAPMAEAAEQLWQLVAA